MTNHPAILYVEDDPESRLVMQILLTEVMGLTHVTIFEDSQAFMPRLRALQSRPDIIFLDIHVRPIDGFQMLDMLRAHGDYQAVPVVALTASVMNDEVRKLKEAGFDGVISKPVDQDEFPAVIQRILAGQPI
jgi:CheY-like chemotaxis protein